MTCSTPTATRWSIRPTGGAAPTSSACPTEEQHEGDTLDHRLAEEEPDIVPEVVGARDADSPTGSDQVIEGSDVADGAPGVHHGQIDGVPEDGESLFPVVEDATRRSDEP